MLVDAIYVNGSIIVNQSFDFVHTRFAVKVDFPDSEIICHVEPRQAIVSENPKNSEYPSEYLNFINRQNDLFGVDYHYKSDKTDREIMQENWVTKYA